MSATAMESRLPIFGFSVGAKPSYEGGPTFRAESSLAMAMPHGAMPLGAKEVSGLTLPPLPFASKSPATPAPLPQPKVDRAAAVDSISDSLAPLSLHFAGKPSASAPNNVGWSGLLAISRNSGASGVLGCQAPAEDEPAQLKKIEVCCTAHTNTNVRRLMKSVIRGLKADQEPEKSQEGMGGTYFFTNEYGRKVAIMKPCDEEPLAPNNPKGYVGRSLGEPGWKPTVRVGEAAMREVAAYLLDHEGWARVPTSVLVRARHPIFCYNSRMSSVRQSYLDLSGHAAANDPSGDGVSSPSALPMKLGSLQEFVPHMCDTSEMGPSKFAARDVHRIAILDIRLFNTDRHAGNMLVREARRERGSCMNLAKPPMMAMADSLFELIPIDHGFCLPETLEACFFEWMHWPQAMLPFTQEELAYIAALDIEADKELLRKELPNLRPECLRVMEVSTTLLQWCAEAGLTLYEIASVMTRPYEGGDEEPSQLEKTVAEALTQAMQEPEEDCVCDDTIEEALTEEDTDLDTDVEDNDEHEVPELAGRYALTPLAKQPSSTGVEDSMLFDLEEDGTPRTPLRAQLAHSPGGISLGSSISSVEDFSFGLNSASPLTSSATPGLGSDSNTGSGSIVQKQGYGAGHADRVRQRAGSDGSTGLAVPMAPLATSVHVTDGGFLWRRLKGKSGPNKHGRQAHKRTPVGGTLAAKKGARICSPQAYPPPVVAFAPDSLNGMFCNLDEAQWARFMHIYKDKVEDALVAGIWKQSLGKDANVAQSCPRF